MLEIRAFISDSFVVVHADTSYSSVVVVVTCTAPRRCCDCNVMYRLVAVILIVPACALSDSPKASSLGLFLINCLLCVICSVSDAFASELVVLLCSYPVVRFVADSFVIAACCVGGRVCTGNCIWFCYVASFVCNADSSS